VHELAFLAVPVLALGYLTLVGAAPAVVLAGRYPADAQAALAPLAGAAMVACASALVPLGVAPRPLAVAVGALGVGMTAVFARRVARALRAGAVLLAIAVAALALSGAPGLARGNWEPASLYGSTDAYHWTSQARAYLDGPAPVPLSEHPDRLTYERSKTQHWAFALPFGLLQLAWISGDDPASLYVALAALTFCLLPLAAYACARTCLGWRPVAAAAGSVALVANAALLFASGFSWQQQLAGTAFAFAAASFLRLALERGAGWGEKVLAALLAAAAIATYRLGFAPYLGALLACVVLVYAARELDVRGIATRLAAVVGAFAVVAGPSLYALARGFSDFVSSGGFSTTFKRTFPNGEIAEALGLVPHVWALKESWPDALEDAWLALASAERCSSSASGRCAARRAPTSSSRGPR
jgi:hypothetical protein